MDRTERLRRALREDELDGMLVSSPSNIRYLTGFSGSSALLMVSVDSAVLVTDSRYGQQAEEEVGGVDEIVISRDGLMETLAGALEAPGDGRRVAFEAHHLTVRRLRELREAATGVDWREGEQVVEDLRSRKDPGEIEALSRAARVTCQALADTLERLEEGMTERQVVGELEYRLRHVGSDGTAFETIVASGPRSALPHARAGERPLREGDLLLFDFGGVVDGYRADFSRTFTVGPANGWQRELHDSVRRAQRRALEAVEAGRPTADVDAAARSSLEEDGLADAFGHSTGHGIGLDVHESPRISSRSDAILQAGNVITVEPGAYLPGRGGVRIEDDVVVEDGAPRVLTDFPRDLVEI